MPDNSPKKMIPVPERNLLEAEGLISAAEIVISKFEQARSTHRVCDVCGADSSVAGEPHDDWCPYHHAEEWRQSRKRFERRKTILSTRRFIPADDPLVPGDPE